MLGIPKENIFILKSGNVLELSDKEAKVVDNVHTGEILVDGLGVGDVVISYSVTVSIWQKTVS